MVNAIKKYSIIVAAASYLMLLYLMGADNVNFSALKTVGTVFDFSLVLCVVFNIGDFIGWVGRKFRGE